ncbi:MFS transporter [Actinoplanes sp. NBRC 101535]|uniref:MFS transporter n=1 Tax=Actinoplanes sp. NBRC 101535 TaxID=3032196 RepID=UPI0024A08A0F|nr:MFS transporter [Actinoplanes sp. NBRC 101535]GLY07037.1 MFS transporter [Actinoplanes sp. NBRC 101535]
MTASLAAAPTRQLRQARAAVAALFLTNGAVFFNIVPRYPEIKESLGVGNAVLGTALAAYPVGALISGLFAAVVIRRYHSARVGAFGIVLTTLITLAIPAAPNWIAFAGVLFLVGSLDSVVDVAQNAHGLRVQRSYGRSILNSLHGVWSIGAVIGGLMGSAAAGLHLSLSVHLAISAVTFSLVALVAYRFLLSGPDDADRDSSPVSSGSSTSSSSSAGGWRRYSGTVVRILAALSVLAACGALVEDAGASWGALYLSDYLNAAAATAGLAVVVFQAAMTAGRLAGDRVVDRFGQRTVARVGAALAALGMGGALAFPTVATALIGFALAGLGFATLVPAAMHAADELPGLPHGTGLTIVSWLLRVGFLVSPPLVGFVADLTSLRVGLLTVVVAGVLTFVFARVLSVRQAVAN